jgi:TonB family protein
MLSIFIRYSVLFMCLILLQSGCKRNDIQSNKKSNTTDTLLTQDVLEPDSLEVKGFNLTDYDTPPTPIQNPMPIYPVKYRKSGIQGVVVLDVQVLSDGHVGEVIVHKSLLAEPGGLDDTAVSAIKSWLFKPASKDNKPIESRVNIPIPFSLKSSN